MKTWIRLLLTIAMVSLAGCGGPTNDGQRLTGGNDLDSGGTIGISVQTLTNPFFKVIADTVTEEAAQHGYEVLIRDAQQKIENQKDQVDEFIVKEVDAMILCPRDTKAIGPVIRTANDAGIPVFTVDTVCEDPKAKVTFHVGTDNVQGGHVAGKAMIDSLGAAGGKIALLDFKRVDSCLDRVKGFTAEIDKYNETAANKIKIAIQLNCNGDKEHGMSAAREAMQAHSDLVGMFAINDPGALGARAAVEAEGKEDEIVIVGFDGQPEAKEAIRDGKLFDSPVQFPDKMAVEVVAAIVRYFDGEEIEPHMLIKTTPYRKEDAINDPNLSNAAAVEETTE